MNPTLGKVLKDKNPELSWSQIKRAILSGRATVDGSVIREDSFRVSENAQVVLHTHKPLKDESLNESLHVYYFDAHIIVFEKVSGIESIPFSTKQDEASNPKRYKKDGDSMATAINDCRRWLERKERRRLPPLRVVHRLDKGTSGVMMFARTLSAERKLAQQFRDHTIERVYEAAVFGKPLSHRIESYLVKDRGDGFRGSSQQSHTRASSKAITHVKLVESRGAISLVECRLETGRTHQIRIHLSESGHPLCGDTVYRKPSLSSATVADNSQAPRIMLHARELSIEHPFSGLRLHFVSAKTEEFRQLWSELKSDR